MPTCTVECVAVFSCFIRSSLIKSFWILQDWTYSHTEESQIVRIAAAKPISSAATRRTGTGLGESLDVACPQGV